MPHEMIETGRAPSPEWWQTYGTCSFSRRTVIEQGQNPYRITSLKRSDAEAALREIRRSLEGPPRDRLLAWLSELYLKTARPGSNDEDFKARLQIYARDLAGFPADIVLEAIRDWRGTFFPAFTELAVKIETDRRLAERRTRIEALELFLAGRQDEKPKGKPVTPEFIATLRAKYRSPVQNVSLKPFPQEGGRP